jgi:hypothetical protein
MGTATARPSPTNWLTWHCRPRATTTSRGIGGTVVALALGLAAAAPASAFWFQTPSHNIACQGTTKYIRCDTRFATRYGAERYRPKGCDLDWDQGFSMGPRTRSHVFCHGDTALNPDVVVLRYGRSKVFAKHFRCTSRRSGLRCQNRAGHGWFLSRQRQALF